MFKCKWSIINTETGKHVRWAYISFEATGYQDFLRQAESWVLTHVGKGEYIIPTITHNEGYSIDVHWWYDSSEDDYVLAI
jgi:hypothetical protein